MVLPVFFADIMGGKNHTFRKGWPCAAALLLAARATSKCRPHADADFFRSLKLSRKPSSRTRSPHRLRAQGEFAKIIQVVLLAGPNVIWEPCGKKAGVEGGDF